MTVSVSRMGKFALMAAHCAGMVDLVALPLWIGTLIQRYGLDPQQAGGTVTLFLFGGVLASVIVAMRMGTRFRRRIAAGGFAISAIAFGVIPGLDAAPLIAFLHFIAGISAGSALSMAHGTIGRSSDPHRLFAVAGIALGVFAIMFLGGMAPLARSIDGLSLFSVLAVVMAFASVVCAVAFPRGNAVSGGLDIGVAVRIPRQAWFAVTGISIMALVQAMVFSFLERAGYARGFSVGEITALFIAIGAVNLFPAAIAAMLQHAVRAHVILLAGPVVQAVLGSVIMGCTTFAPYAFAASLLSAVMIFTHTFAFGLIGRLDPAGRALSATPAMLMTGAAVGPLLGGTLVKAAGYGSIALAVCGLACVAVACFAQVNKHAAQQRLGVDIEI